MGFRLACLAAACALAAVAVPGTARADFFDDARKTFTNDIPHFFQDDVPCTFGGRPTSGTRQTCRQEKPAPPPPAPARPVVKATEPPVHR